MVEVDMGEALGLLSALQWVRDLQLLNMDFETDSKTVVDSIYGNKQGVSDFNAIINECRDLLSSDLATSDVRFIRRQANEVAHSLARVAPCHASFCIFIRIPSLISTLFLNEMH
jgi:ribonuclease HI